jgi:Trypsin-co-occurring domain 2
VVIVAEEPGLGLSDALEALRDELETAWASGDGKAVRFGVREVTLTLEAVARREVEGSGKIRFWVVEAGGGGKAGAETTQKLVLTLTPGRYDQQGRRGPLEVAGDQPEPGQ